jgi:hypothetical protein
MLFLRTSNGEYPVYLATIQGENPGVSLPAEPTDAHVSPLGFRRVTETAQPSFDPGIEKLVEGAPVLSSGSYVQVWNVVAMDSGEVVSAAAARKADVIANIKSYRDVRTQTMGYTTGGKWYHSDIMSRTQQIALVTIGANLPPGIQWKTMDGSFVTMTQQLALDIFNAAVASDTTVFAHAEDLISQVNACVTVGAVNAINIYAGWPAGYGE